MCEPFSKLAVILKRRRPSQLFRLHLEMPALRNQLLNLSKHPRGKLRVAGGERDNNRLRVLAENRKMNSLSLALNGIR